MSFLQNIKEEWALYHIEYSVKVETMLKRLSDDELEALITELNSNKIYEQFLTYALAEKGIRISFKKATELNCETFCSFHQCCMENCVDKHDLDEEE